MESTPRDSAQTSPRRVAVPVLVKDGKPCGGNSGGGSSSDCSSSEQGTPNGSGHTPQLPSQNQPPLMAPVVQQDNSMNHLSSPSLSSYGNAGVMASSPYLLSQRTAHW